MVLIGNALSRCREKSRSCNVWVVAGSGLGVAGSGLASVQPRGGRLEPWIRTTSPSRMAVCNASDRRNHRVASAADGSRRLCPEEVRLCMPAVSSAWSRSRSPGVQNLAACDATIKHTPMIATLDAHCCGCALLLACGASAGASASASKCQCNYNYRWLSLCVCVPPCVGREGCRRRS